VDAALVRCSTWNSRRSASAEAVRQPVVSLRRRDVRPYGPFGFLGAARRGRGDPSWIAAWCSTWNIAQRAPLVLFHMEQPALPHQRTGALVRCQPQATYCPFGSPGAARRRSRTRPGWPLGVPRGTAAPRMSGWAPPLARSQRQAAGRVSPDGSCSSQVQRTAVADSVCMPRSEQPLLHIRGSWRRCS
jgi:hypothetical protein